MELRASSPVAAARAELAPRKTRQRSTGSSNGATGVLARSGGSR